jgi:predicted AAA+ superfamily ATPase
MHHVDVYITGSNSKLLISDVVTIFRGRGQSIQVTPLSFSEFMPLRKGCETQAIFNEYLTFGGLPKCVLAKSDAERKAYLDELYRTIYLRDIIERNKIKEPAILESLLDVVMSGIGGLTNPNKISATINTEAKLKTNNVTISKYLDLLENAFLITKAKRYDVKGRKHLKSLSKYYTIDPGLRNSRVNFRQNEQTHLMENVIYNELIRRGYSVDVGIVQLETRVSGRHEMRQYEIDFVVNKADERIYIQSAYALETDEKRIKELKPFSLTGDSFRKVIVRNDVGKRWYDDTGILNISLLDFLLDPAAIG